MSAQAIVKEKITIRPKSKSAVPIAHCPGCHYGSIIRILCECIDELGIQGNTILLGGVGCSYGWPVEFETDGASCPHGRATDMATALKRLHPDAILITCQGDGDLAAIGLGSFLNAVQRGELITTILLNNAVYGTTGGQMAPTTLLEQVTTTTPAGRDPKVAGYPIHVAELVATCRGMAYSARVSVHTPANFRRAKKAMKTALEKQVNRVGYSFVEFLSACPANWRLTPRECLTFISEKMLAEYPLGVFKDVDKIE